MAGKRAVFANADLPQGAVDRDAYVVCVLEALHRALAVRDVFATPSLRWPTRAPTSWTAMCGRRSRMTCWRRCR